MSISGGCMCGAVRYELTEPPMFAGFCYCEDCRRGTGTHSANVAVPESALKITGETREFSKLGGSGNEVVRVFCPVCGGGLLARPAARQGIVMLKAGTLDDPELFKPMACIFVSRAPSWDKPPEGVPSFPEARPPS